MANKKLSEYVWIEWQGPTYSTFAHAQSHELFQKTGKWDYGMHVKGERFEVLRSDADRAPHLYFILDPEEAAEAAKAAEAEGGK